MLMKNVERFLLISFFLLALSSFVTAVVPDVNFNIIPSTGFTGQNIIFDPVVTPNGTLSNLQWQFDSDGNTNYFGGQTNIVYADFDTNFDNWVVQNGSASIVSNSLQTGSVDTTISKNISYGDNNSILNVYTRMKITTAGNAVFAFNEDDVTQVPSSYNIALVSSLLEMRFRLGTTNILTIQGISLGTYYDINAVRSSDGNWSFYVNGSYVSSTIDNSSIIDGNIAKLIYDDSSTGFANWEDVIIFSGSTNIPYDQNQNHVFNTAGTKNICLTAGNPDGNKTTCNNLIINNGVTITILDEESNLAINGASVTIDSNTQTTDSSGQVFFNTDTISFPITLQVSATNYSDRNFYYLTNNGLLQDKNIGLRSSSETSSISFRFYAPNQTTTLNNRLIVVTRNNAISGRNITDSTGFTNFVLAPTDGNYNFLIYPVGIDVNSSTIDYNYLGVSVTINRPKDESTSSSINGNFSLTVGGLGLQDYNSVGSFPFSSIAILGNTQEAYTLRVVDTNSTGQVYYARQYVMQTTGDTSSLTINPYLIKIIDGTLINLRVIDIPSNLSIPNVRVTLNIGISGINTVVEDIITDSAGISQVVMSSQKIYNFNVTSPNGITNYFSGTLSPSANSISIYINYTDSNQSYESLNIFSSFYPTDNTIDGTTQRIDFNISADFDYDSVTARALDGNRLIALNTSTNNPYNGNFLLTLTDFNSNNVVIQLIVRYGDQNTIITKNYFITSTGYGGILNLVGLSNNFNPMNYLVTLIVVIILVVGSIGKGKFGSVDQMVYIGGILLSLVGYLLFREYFTYIIGALVVGMIAWIWTRVNK